MELEVQQVYQWEMSVKDIREREEKQAGKALDYDAGLTTMKKKGRKKDNG